jgi:hypothetical protein
MRGGPNTGKRDRKRGGPVWAKAEEVREERTSRKK